MGLTAVSPIDSEKDLVLESKWSKYISNVVYLLLIWKLQPDTHNKNINSQQNYLYHSL